MPQVLTDRADKVVLTKKKKKLNEINSNICCFHMIGHKCLYFRSRLLLVLLIMLLHHKQPDTIVFENVQKLL